MGLCSGHGNSVVIRELSLYPQSLLAKLTVHFFVAVARPRTVPVELQLQKNVVYLGRARPETIVQKRLHGRAGVHTTD